VVVRVLRDRRGVVVAEVRRERGHQHQAAVELARDLGAIGLDPGSAVLFERAARIAEQPDECSALWASSGLNALSSKLLAPQNEIATSLPSTCAHTMVRASFCVGLTLPGMIELPGSLWGPGRDPG